MCGIIGLTNIGVDSIINNLTKNLDGIKKVGERVDKAYKVYINNKQKNNKHKKHMSAKQISEKMSEMLDIVLDKTLDELKALKRGSDGYGLAIKNKKTMITAYSKSIEQLKKNIKDIKLSDELELIFFHSLHAMVGFRLQPIVKNVDNVKYQKNQSMIIANCEIYNWKQISTKENIKAKNDTELILGLLDKGLSDKRLKRLKYRKEKDIYENEISKVISNSLELLDGIYAFAYANNKYLVLARDAIGINPLWIAVNKERLLGFASSKHALEELGFDNVIELNPRMVVVSRLDDFKIKAYYKDFFSIVNNSRDCSDLTPNEIQNIKDILIKAVAKRLDNITKTNGKNAATDNAGIIDNDYTKDLSVYKYNASKYNADKNEGYAIGSKQIPQHALLFSGGLDSSILAKIMKDLSVSSVLKDRVRAKILRDKIINNMNLNNTNFKTNSFRACVIGVRGSKDLIKAGLIAKKLGIQITKKELTIRDVELLAKDVVKIAETTDPVKVSVGIVTLAACRLAKQLGCKSVITGLGADDLFMGYHRQLTTPDTIIIKGRVRGFNTKRFSKQEILSSLRKLYERDCYRDNSLAMNIGLEIRLPFLDKELIDTVLKYPDNCFYENKKLLRMIAKNLGLDRDLVTSKKHAAQYSSGVYKSLKTIAKKEGTTVSNWLYKLRKKPNARLALLASTGKDSWAAAWIMYKRNYAINCLVSVIPLKDSFLFHHPCIELVKTQSIASGIPLISVRANSNDTNKEIDALKKALKKAINNYNIEGVITGALYSNYQRNRFEQVIDGLGLKIYNPLWHTNQESFMRMVSKNFKVVISSVSAEGLTHEWVGRLLTKKNVERLIELSKRYGFNAAGEGGEFETLVLDMPLFKKQIALEGCKVEKEDKSATLSVKKAILKNKG